PWDPIRIPPGSSTCTWQAQDNVSTGASGATAFASWKGAWQKAQTNNVANQMIQFGPDAYLQGYDYDKNGTIDNCTDASINAGSVTTSSTAGIKIYGSTAGCGTFVKGTSGITFLRVNGISGDNVEVKNIYFHDFGQAIEIKDAQNVLIENCVFDKVNQMGAAGIFIECATRNTTVTFLNCKFVNNKTQSKTAVDILRSATNPLFKLTANFTDCDFVCNDNTSYGGALTINGQQAGVTVNITGGTFGDNATSAAQGGAISIGSLAGTNDPVVNLTDVNFYRNRVLGAPTGSSDGGGAIHVGQKSTLNVFGGSFYGNRSTGNGGAIQCAGAGSATLVTLNINSTGTKETFFGADTTATSGGGGGFYLRNATATVRNVAFNANVVTGGGQAWTIGNASGSLNINNRTYGTQTTSNLGGGTLTDGGAAGPVYVAPTNVTHYLCGNYCAVTVPSACTLMHATGSAGTSNTAVCFSASATGSISGVAFNDFNRDGVNNDLNFCNNVYVLLYDNSGNLIARTNTNISGAYSFTGVPDGQYYVVFTPPIATPSVTFKNVAGSTGATDSDVDLITLRSFTITINTLLSNTNSNDETTAALNQTNVNAGFYGADGGVLPVQIISFQAQYRAPGNTLVTWKVADEIQITQYEILSSADGINFRSIGTVTAAQKALYTFVDPTINGQWVYYKIKVIESNGHFAYTQTIRIGNRNNNAISIYPNPASKQLNIRFNEPGIQQ
ncbi:MAG: SdrD B-like domain-containing protein, partial [Ferruginibacter sp.]